MSILSLTVQKQNLLYYTFILVILGTPIWWYTTDTYRATLPRAHISQLKQYSVAFNIPLAVCYDPAEFQKQHIVKLLTSIKPFILLKSPRPGRVVYDIQSTIVPTCGDEHPFSVMFTNNVKRIRKSELSEDDRYLKVSPEKEISELADDIMTYMDLDLLHKHVLLVDNPDLHLHNQDVRNAMAVATSYNILVSVVNPEPAHITLNPDMASGTDTYLKHFLDSVSGLARFTYQTQILRYIPLSVRPVEYEDYFYISESNLPHLINPIESKLGTSTTNDINLILYLVEEKSSPLYIRTSDSRITLPSFLSPQFGSVLLYDVRNKTSISHSEVFGIFLPQLKQLLGLRSSNSPLVSSRDSFLMEARATLTHILRSIDTLNSLITLTDSIANMVIGDHIKDQVNSAITGIEDAQAALEQNDYKTALKQASLARDAAEKSFSDPSILALLYFPDDQKFAIYIPLFLPVGLPLLVAFFELIKEWKAKKYVKSKSE